MELKAPLTIEEQVNRLIAHGMTVESPREAADFLSYINYYRLSGYALQFRDENGQDYKAGTSFNAVRKLYEFDEELRGVLRESLDRAEATMRTKIAYGFSIEKCKNSPHDGHYHAENFARPNLQRKVLDSLKEEEGRRADSLIVQHHQKKYDDKMPLWVIVELLSMASLSLLYRSMLESERTSIAISCGKSRSAELANHLHVLTVLRNKCSHGGRLYGTTFTPPAMLGSYYLKRHPEVKVDAVFAAILVLFRCLPTLESRQRLKNSLVDLLSKYKNCVDLGMLGIPQNYLSLMAIEVNRT